MAKATAAKAATAETGEVPEWANRPVEGDPSTGEGKVVEVAQAVTLPTDDEVLQSLMDWCQQYMEENAADSAAAMAASVRRILAGEDAVDVLTEKAPLNGKDHPDKPFLLRSFNLNPTDYSEGWPFYASMDCEVPGTGDAFVLNCGGPKVIAALYRLHQINEYPYAVKIQAKTTRQGFTVLSLVTADA